MDYEKLGVFYLGRPYDLAAEAAEGRPRPLRLARPRHARRVRRHDRQRQDRPLPRRCSKRRPSTASRRIVIDPKGDLGNLLLTFPEPRAARISARGSTRTMRGGRACRPTTFAAQQAEMWKKGLAEWGQDGARIQRLRDAADFAIYTPGQQAGHPGLGPAVVRRAAARGRRRRRAAARAHQRRRRRACWACSGIDADPLRAREHILLSTHPRHGLARRAETSTSRR